MTEWISVKDEMPPIDEPVFYLRANREGKLAVGVAYWTVSKKWHPEEAIVCADGFTHWMPIPEPPKDIHKQIIHGR